MAARKDSNEKKPSVSWASKVDELLPG